MIMGEVKDRGLLKDEQIKELTETYTKVYLDNIKNTLSMMSMDLNGDAS